MDYIRKRRLAKSLEELKPGTKNIIDIALYYRFNSLNSFTKAFKWLYRIGPEEFHRSKKNDIITRDKLN